MATLDALKNPPTSVFLSTRILPSCIKNGPNSRASLTPLSKAPLQVLLINTNLLLVLKPISPLLP